MPDSSADENYPINDEPTRDFGGELGGDDGMDFDDVSFDMPLEMASDSALANDQLAKDEEDWQDSVPSQLGGYEIKKLIGKGGMGRVFLAEHLHMRRTVAIKMLPSDRMKDQSAIERFYAEVQAASRLMHPNIVAAFDAGEADGVHYMVMEYVDGYTLTQIVSRKGPLSVGEAASVIRQAALGLLHAHRAGLVHRDVKPGNLMRAADGTIKILDMGLAQLSAPLWTASLGEGGKVTESGIQRTLGEEAKSRKGKLMGTLAYMAPEQLESPEEADPRSDIYSLGAVLHFLLLGKPPYTGEYLDQVYGHRHGEIPDLMQLRDDVDLNFANIFRRMMAKTPGQRYASLDEVIDDLSDYSDTTDAPLWLAEFTQRQTGSEATTHVGGSTSGTTAEVLAIDVGMFYSSAAVATPTGDVTNLPAGGAEDKKSIPLMRMAIASDEGQLLYGVDAMQLRASKPSQVVHCLPMYLGKDKVDREICSQRCPPEVLLAMLFKRIVANAWTKKSAPSAVALTVPASYDQLHRRSILQAAEMAGLKSVRLVDRSVAAVQSLLLSDYGVTELDESLDDYASSDGSSETIAGQLDASVDELILFIGITGQAAEVAVLKRDSLRLQQVFTAGHWHTGSLAWLHRLVDLASEQFVSRHNVDPRKSRKTAAALQLACERAMNSLLLLPMAKITIEINGVSTSVSIFRSQWLEHSADLIAALKKNIADVCKGANVSMQQFSSCVTVGPLMRLAEVRSALFEADTSDASGSDTASGSAKATDSGKADDDPSNSTPPNQPMKFVALERSDIASGAAACLAGELPGRREVAMPPMCVTSQSIGIVVEDTRGRRRILPIMPRGTALPARTNRRLTVGKERDSMTLSLVESSGVNSTDWQSLGRYTFEIEAGHANRLKRTRMIGFELNINGMLLCRAQTPGTPGSTKLSILPAPMLSDDEVATWKKWINDLTN
ncbi:protein kinase domain-containing protein [Planctomycetes bacterium K23_9]|uniref:Serine/threonine-protein kinase PrkC n=1 Tax=Stieleria marina TaxID=1930275 RepID=A0A517NNH8_9BACT|nr:Serine/threonine-protein kinase PrkC [Planctomycetes bacterium K23_9]